MFTFTESYSTPSFYLKEGVSALKEYILDILNTDRGSRPYYPDYGFLLDKYKFSLLNYQLAEEIHSEVYFVINSIDNITILETNYKLDVNGKKLNLYFNLKLGQDPIGVHLTYQDGGFV